MLLTIDSSSFPSQKSLRRRGSNSPHREKRESSHNGRTKTLTDDILQSWRMTLRSEQSNSVKVSYPEVQNDHYLVASIDSHLYQCQS